MLDTDTDIAVVDPPSQGVQSGALFDLRTAKYLPPEQMQRGLTEFISRRAMFRRWLMTVLQVGVHYGTVPGCEPKFDNDGNLTQWSKGKTIVIGKDQWVWRPSFYKSGAELLCELFAWRPVFQPDLVTWEMLGKPKALCLICQLVNQSGDIVGEGRAARDEGQKAGNTNNVIKMAQKCGQVDAVIRTLAISDLFTQDVDDDGAMPPKHPNPEADPDAPEQAARAQRVDEKALTTLIGLWKSNNKGATKEGWQLFASRAVGRDFVTTSPSSWTMDEFEIVKAAVNEELNGVTPY